MKIKLPLLAALLFANTCFAQAPIPGSNLYPVNDHGKYGFINRDGDMVISPQYDDAGYFYEGLAAVKINGKYGFIDAQNKMTIEPQFDTTLHFSEGWCAVGFKEEGMPLQWGYVNTAGMGLPAQDLTALGMATNFSSNRAMVSEQGFDDPFFINRKGRTLFKQGDFYFFTDEDNNHFSDGILKVMKPSVPGTMGAAESMFIDTNGKILDQFKSLDYPATGSFHEGLMWYLKDMKYGFLDKSGREVIKAQYDTVLDFSEGWARVSQKMEFNPLPGRLEGGIHGYINQLGEWVLEPKARTSYSFHEGYARVFEKGKWGYMNTSGTILIPAEYDEAEDFYRGLARAKKNGRWFYLNTRGKVVWEETTE